MADDGLPTHPNDEFRDPRKGRGLFPAGWRVVLFDVDGTLIDSNDAHAHAWTRALQDYGVDTDVDRVRRLIGMGGDKLLPAVADIPESSGKGQAITRRKRELFDELLPTLHSTRGAHALLAYLRQKGIRLAIASSAGDEELHALLKQAGLDGLIPTKTTKDDVRESKPDADIVHAALAKTAAQPGEAVLVGDTPYDIEAARRAGVSSIALRCGGYWPDEALVEALATYDDPEDLLAHWTRDP